MLDKHKPKLYKGFIKQAARQDAKETFVKVKLYPEVLTYSYNKGEYTPVKIKHYNNKWNGMNLKNLCNAFNKIIVGGMYGKFAINKEGKYILSRHGKDLLRRRRLKKNISPAN